jgi:hypothetical protein
MEWPSSPELPFEGIELITDVSQHWRLKDIQREQADILQEEGLIVQALLHAQRLGQNIPEESAFWACVFRRFNPGGNIPVGGGIRVTAQYAPQDIPQQLTVDILVFSTIANVTLECRPFTAPESVLVEGMLERLLLERTYGDLPALSEDLTTIPFIPTP